MTVVVMGKDKKKKGKGKEKTAEKTEKKLKSKVLKKTGEVRHTMLDRTFLVSYVWPKPLLSTCSVKSVTGFRLHLTLDADENESHADKNE